MDVSAHRPGAVPTENLAFSKNHQKHIEETSKFLKSLANHHAFGRMQFSEDAFATALQTACCPKHALTQPRTLDIDDPTKMAMSDKDRLGRYEELEKIGEGTYGVVQRAKTPEGGVYALKHMRLEAQAEGLPSTAIREIALLKELRHPNVVKLFDVIHARKGLTLVFECLEMDLKQLLDECPNGLDSDLTKLFLFQLLHGVAFCHHKNVLHRDLKPQNIFVSRQGQLKLGDFGLARGVGVPVRAYTNGVVTLWYRAPDLLLGSCQYSTPVDLWSVGCIFAEMITGSPLFAGTSENDQIHQIVSKTGTIPQSACPTMKDQTFEFEQCEPQPWSALVPGLNAPGVDLLARLLEYDPHKRISARDAMRHPYFHELTKSLSLGA